MFFHITLSWIIQIINSGPQQIKASVAQSAVLQQKADREIMRFPSHHEIFKSQEVALSILNMGATVILEGFAFQCGLTLYNSLSPPILWSLFSGLLIMSSGHILLKSLLFFLSPQVLVVDDVSPDSSENFYRTEPGLK